ncbi:MAG: hypothetical protein H0U74_06160 [Bradymonadaceae bacterium]|nr:hypothetical protein [Lujinxingiaceae bacterium]
MKPLNASPLIGLGLAAAMSMLAAGCGEDVEGLGSGSLSLSWEVSPRGCESAEVTQVEVELKNSNGLYTERYACTDGRAWVDAVSPGNYRLNVRGLDRHGRETFASSGQSVTVRAEMINTAETVRLTAKPASVQVGWVFDNGRVCGANGVDAVELAVYDSEDFEMMRRRFSCNAGEGSLVGLAAGSYLVEAVAEVRGVTAFRGFSEVHLKRGDLGLVEVILEQQ